jgi:NAD(P)-dependent dehydrogenase (short-subunit alcohol dehydrogenase family)
MLEGFISGDEQVERTMTRAVPLGRLGVPSEIAEAVVWLCSDAASFVVGHALAVDGGSVVQ